MKIQTFKRKYNNKVIEDWGCMTSEDFKRFSRDFKSTIKDIAIPVNGEVVSFNSGHYYVSSFIKINEKYIYISYEANRGNKSLDLTRDDCFFGILVRKAKNEKDYHGESNHFCNIDTLLDTIKEILFIK